MVEFVTVLYFMVQFEITHTVLELKCNLSPLWLNLNVCKMDVVKLINLELTEKGFYFIYHYNKLEFFQHFFIYGH